MKASFSRSHPVSVKTIALGAPLLVVCAFVLGDGAENLASSYRGHATTQFVSSTQVLSDTGEPLPGVLVKADNSITTTTLATNGNGQTAWFPMLQSMEVTLTFSDAVVPEGHALGMVRRVEPFHFPSGSADAASTLYSFSQPVAQQVFIADNPSGFNAIGPSNQTLPYWQLVPRDGSSLSFGAHVATLLDTDEVDAWAEYRGVDLNGMQYARGVVMLVPGVQLGGMSSGGGLGLVMELMGDLDSGANGVAVDLFNVYTSSATPIGPALDGAILTTDTTDNGVVVYAMEGGVRQGYLAALVRRHGGSDGSVHVVADAPPTLTVTPLPTTAWMEGHDTEALVGETPAVFDPSWGHPGGPVEIEDCTPCTPTPPSEWTCASEIEEPTWHSAGCTTEAAGPVVCKTQRTATQTVCKVKGASTTQSKAIAKEFKASIQFTSNSGAIFTTGSGFPYGGKSKKISVDSWTADDRAFASDCNGSESCENLGECYRMYRWTLTCTRPWSVGTHLWTWGDEGNNVQKHPCAQVLLVGTGCDDSYESDADCCRKQS